MSRLLLLGLVGTLIATSVYAESGSVSDLAVPIVRPTPLSRAPESELRKVLHDGSVREMQAAKTERKQDEVGLGVRWVEVRLPDNRRAWAPTASLVVGSFRPLAPDQIVRFGRDFLGVPYKWGGVDPNGWDCSGFIQEVFRLGGHRLPRMADAQYEACERVALDSLLPGDLVFFNLDGKGISHVGVYTGNGLFLHASSSRGVVEDRLDSPYFAGAYVGAGRLQEWVSLPIEPISDVDFSNSQEKLEKLP